MVEEKKTYTRSEMDYERRYFSYYKFRLRVYLCAFLCLVAVAFVVGSLVIQVFNSSTIFPKTYEMSEGDMRTITVSTTFCEGISLERSKLTRSLSIVSQVNLAKVKSVANITLDILFPVRKYWYKSFYLLKGSSIQIEASSDHLLQLLIFKGRTNLDGWIDKQTRQHTAMPINSNNHNKRTRISFVYQITQEGNYYILFQHISGDSRVPKLSLALFVTRQLYDISSAVSSCNAGFGQSCYARLLFNSNEKTLLKVSGSSKYLYMKNLPTTWHCQPRIWFFLVVFGVGYIFCVILVLVFYVLLMNRKRQAFFRRPRKPSVKSQNSFSGSSRAGGSLKRKNSKEGSIRSSSCQTSSLRCQRNRPLSANGSLGRHKQQTSLPSVIPHIYNDGNTDSENEEDACQRFANQASTSSPRQSLLHRAPSLENISIASFDTTMSLPVTFSTFKNRLFDAETASCHSFDVDSSLRRHRNRHHPRFHQELKRDRDIISARSRARFEAQEREKLASHQSDSQIYCDDRSLTLPTRISSGRRAERDFDRDLDLARERNGERCSHQSDSQLNCDQKIKTLPRENRTKRDFYRDLELVRKQERDRHHQSDSQLQKTTTLPREGRTTREFYRHLDLARHSDREPLLSNDKVSLPDTKYLTLPRPSRQRPKRDFYRDLELASKRDLNYNKNTATQGISPGPDSDYERECERVLEHVDFIRPKHRRVENHHEQDDSDQCSIGDILDRVADEDKPKRATNLSGAQKSFSNGCPPQMIKAKPVQDHENHLVIIAQPVSDGEVKNDTKNKKDKNSNKKDVKLRNHSSRRKENFWKPRLSIVSEV